MGNTHKTCFVIMGFGVKTDYQTSRELDLDKCYKHIIKPAIKAAGLKCIRADEIPHSGPIDVPMFEQLLNADLVLADLSSSNLNAIYELGVRHALKPHTTLIIAEEQFSNPFDISHIVMHRYRHDGKVLDIEEVNRFTEQLTRAVVGIMEEQMIDSPVYTTLHNLAPPQEHSTELRENSSATSPYSLAELQQQVEDCKKRSDFLSAKSVINEILKISPRETQWVQQLALVTYKAEAPDTISALYAARDILQTLKPLHSNNAETLGLWGSIHKRIFDINSKREALDMAISSYEKGYRLLNDYYNGINWAFLLNIRASISDNRGSAIADFILAQRTRAEVLKITQAKFAEINAIHDIDNIDDRYWILATQAEALVGLDRDNDAQQCLQQADAYAEDWMQKSTNEQINKLKQLLEDSPLKGL